MKKANKVRRERTIVVVVGMVILALGLAVYAYQKGYLQSSSEPSTKQQNSTKKENADVVAQRDAIVAKQEAFKALREPVNVAVSDNTLYNQVKVHVAEEGARIREFVDNQLTNTFTKINQQLAEHKRHIIEEAAQVKSAVHQTHQKTVGHVQDAIKRTDVIENQIQSLKYENEELQKKRYQEKKARFKRKVAESQVSVSDRIRDEVKKQLMVE